MTEQVVDIERQGQCPDCGQEKRLVYWTLCAQWICRECLAVVRRKCKDFTNS